VAPLYQSCYEFLLSNGWAKGDDGRISRAVSFASETILPWLSLFQERLATDPDSQFYLPVTGLAIAALSLLYDTGRQ